MSSRARQIATALRAQLARDGILLEPERAIDDLERAILTHEREERERAARVVDARVEHPPYVQCEQCRLFRATAYAIRSLGDMKAKP